MVAGVSDHAPQEREPPADVLQRLREAVLALDAAGRMISLSYETIWILPGFRCAGSFVGFVGARTQGELNLKAQQRGELRMLLRSLPMATSCIVAARLPSVNP